MKGCGEKRMLVVADMFIVFRDFLRLSGAQGVDSVFMIRLDNPNELYGP